VEKIHFNSGDEVKEGAILVSLDARTDSAQLKALEAAARLAEQEYERFQTLFKQGSISRSELDRRQSERDQALATANAQRERVAQKTIRAPFSGKLGIRQVDLGQYLNPGNAVVTLQQLNPIYVNFSLPERDQALLKAGLAVRASLSAMPDELFEGEISASNRALTQPPAISISRPLSATSSRSCAPACLPASAFVCLIRSKLL
jgi:membrane fusion protein, multidrug efflux system